MEATDNVWQSDQHPALAEIPAHLASWQQSYKPEELYCVVCGATKPKPLTVTEENSPVAQPHATKERYIIEVRAEASGVHDAWEPLTGVSAPTAAELLERWHKGIKQSLRELQPMARLFMNGRFSYRMTRLNVSFTAIEDLSLE